MVCIIDDREDVWSYATNLIHVKPYHFFQHTGDINAPPGLEKHEADDKEGVDLTKLAKKNSTAENETEKQSATETLNGTVEKSEPKSKDENVTSEKETIISNNGDVEKHVDDVSVDSECKTEEESVNNDDKSTLAVNNSSEAISADAQLNVKNPPVSENQDKKQSNNVVDGASKDEEELIDIEDPDDYLLHLEDILKRIHKAFYEEYDRMESGAVPDLKTVIPTVRSQVLRGTKLVFSGLVPTHIKLEQSKAYQVAKSLGADVTQDLKDDTTHLVAVRPGTAKVNAGRRRKNIKIVTPDWLWACAEWWEHVEEKLFVLSNKGSKNRHPPPHCSSPEHNSTYPVHDAPASRKRSPSGRFMDTINPLMSFSSADIADMDKEVDNILDDDDESESDDANEINDEINLANSLPKSDDESSSSAESLSGERIRGHKRKIEDTKNSSEEEAGGSSLDEFPSTKFRRGEMLDSDLDFGQDSNSEKSDEAMDDVDDGEWNMMGAALEREFLSND